MDTPFNGCLNFQVYNAYDFQFTMDANIKILK